MKRKFSVLLIFFLIAALCVFTLPACKKDATLRYGDYQYTVENKAVTIIKYTGKETNVAIPSDMKGMPVVAIADSAFHGCDTIRSLTIPDSVVSIGSLTFCKCYALERVTLGRGIQEIEFSPFAFCDKMTYNVYESGYYLGNDGNPYLALVGVTFDGIESITIHPDTVVVCGSALENCALLREVVFPESVVSIGSFALQDCTSLESVYIPKGVKSIGILVFENCGSLQKIAVSEENPHFKSVDGSLFSHDGSLLIRYAPGKQVSSYQIPEGTVIIEGSAFEKAKHLTELTLPDSVEEIGHSAFLQCESLRNIHLGNGLKRIEGVAFGCCGSLTHICIPDSVEVLSYSAFSSCDKLETVEIGSGVIRLEPGAFRDCKTLREVVFKDPDGWRASTAYALFSDKMDLSDPKQNADYLTNEYCEHFWHKK